MSKNNFEAKIKFIDINWCFLQSICTGVFVHTHNMHDTLTVQLWMEGSLPGIEFLENTK